jgi:iron complex outermembrane receptor protein
MKGVLSGPLTETLGARLVVFRAKRDGYIYNPDNDFRSYGYDRYGAKLKFLWEPNDSLTARLSLQSVQDDAPRGEMYTDRLLPPLGWVIAAADTRPEAQPYVDSLRTFGDELWESNYTRQPHNKTYGKVATLDVRYDTGIGEFASLSNFTRTTNKVISSSTGNLPFFGHGYSVDERWSQEFRLAGDAGPFSYLAGVYYLDSHTQGGDENPGPNGQNLTRPSSEFVFGSALFDQPSINNIDPTRSVQYQYTPGYEDLQASAVFAQVGYDITDKLNLTAGLRWGRDEISGSVSQFLRTQSGTVTTVLAPFYRETEFDATTGNAVVSYKFTPEVMTYVSYARGNLPGGLNGGGTQAAASTPFKPQNADAYELGVKSTLLDGRMQLNIALFDNNYEDLQLNQNRFVPLPNGAGSVLQSVVSNAASSYARGVEFDTAFALSSHWQASLGYTYLEHEIDKYVIPPGGQVNIDFTGASTPRTPKHSASASLTYENEIGPGQLSLTASGSYTSAYTNEWTGLPAGSPYPGRPGVPAGVTTTQVLWLIETPGYTLWNLNGSYSIGSWQVGGYVRNIFNKEYVAAAGGPSPTTFPSTVPGEPRTFEVSLRYSF